MNDGTEMEILKNVMIVGPDKTSSIVLAVVSPESPLAQKRFTRTYVNSPDEIQDANETWIPCGCWDAEKRPEI